MLVKSEMLDKVEHKKIMISIGSDNKHRPSKNLKQPWWNDHLTDNWNNLCRAEKVKFTC